MSCRWFKKVRALVHHCEYGGNYPAMARSGRKLKAMGPTDRQYRRAEKMADRKLAKYMAADARWIAAGMP